MVPSLSQLCDMCRSQSVHQVTIKQHKLPHIHTYIHTFMHSYTTRQTVNLQQRTPTIVLPPRGNKINYVMSLPLRDRDFQWNTWYRSDIYTFCVQNDRTPMSHLLAGGIRSNGVTCLLAPVVRVYITWGSKA